MEFQKPSKVKQDRHESLYIEKHIQRITKQYKNIITKSKYVLCQVRRWTIHSNAKKDQNNIVTTNVCKHKRKAKEREIEREREKKHITKRKRKRIINPYEKERRTEFYSMGKHRRIRIIKRRKK